MSTSQQAGPTSITSTYYDVDGTAVEHTAGLCVLVGPDGHSKLASFVDFDKSKWRPGYGAAMAKELSRRGIDVGDLGTIRSNARYRPSEDKLCSWLADGEHYPGGHLCETLAGQTRSLDRMAGNIQSAGVFPTTGLLLTVLKSIRAANSILMEQAAGHIKTSSSKVELLLEEAILDETTEGIELFVTFSKMFTSWSEADRMMCGIHSTEADRLKSDAETHRQAYVDLCKDRNLDPRITAVQTLSAIGYDFNG